MRSNTAALESNINVTPLVDVCLVLLIIFMVLTPIIGGDVPVKLPAAKSADPLASGPLKITVNADGTVYINALVIRDEQVASELRAMHADHPAQAVVVRGDRSTKYGAVVKVLDAARSAGYSDVGLVSQPLASAEQVR